MNAGKRLLLFLFIAIAASALVIGAIQFGALDAIEARVYRPAAGRKLAEQTDSFAQTVAQYINRQDSLFTLFSGNTAIRSSTRADLGEEEAAARAHFASSLLTDTPGLNGIRIVNSNGKQIFYSTFPEDFSAHKNGKNEYISYPKTALPYSVIAAEEGERGLIVPDTENGRLVFSYPFYDTEMSYQGTIAFYVDAPAMLRYLIPTNRLGAQSEIVLCSGGNSKLPFGVLFSVPPEIKELCVESAITAWENDRRLARIDAGGSSWLLFSKAAENTGYVSMLYPEASLEMPQQTKQALVVATLAFIFTICVICWAATVETEKKKAKIARERAEADAEHAKSHSLLSKAENLRKKNAAKAEPQAFRLDDKENGFDLPIELAEISVEAEDAEVAPKEEAASVADESAFAEESTAEPEVAAAAEIAPPDEDDAPLFGLLLDDADSESFGAAEPPKAHDNFMEESAFAEPAFDEQAEQELDALLAELGDPAELDVQPHSGGGTVEPPFAKAFTDQAEEDLPIEGEYPKLALESEEPEAFEEQTGGFAEQEPPLDEREYELDVPIFAEDLAPTDGARNESGEPLPEFSLDEEHEGVEPFDALEPNGAFAEKTTQSEAEPMPSFAQYGTEELPEHNNSFAEPLPDEADSELDLPVFAFDEQPPQDEAINETAFMEDLAPSSGEQSGGDELLPEFSLGEEHENVVPFEALEPNNGFTEKTAPSEAEPLPSFAQYSTEELPEQNSSLAEPLLDEADGELDLPVFAFDEQPPQDEAINEAPNGAVFAEDFAPSSGEQSGGDELLPEFSLGEEHENVKPFEALEPNSTFEEEAAQSEAQPLPSFAHYGAEEPPEHNDNFAEPLPYEGDDELDLPVFAFDEQPLKDEAGVDRAHDMAQIDDDVPFPNIPLEGEDDEELQILPFEELPQDDESAGGFGAGAFEPNEPAESPEYEPKIKPIPALDTSFADIDLSLELDDAEFETARRSPRRSSLASIFKERMEQNQASPSISALQKSAAEEPLKPALFSLGLNAAQAAQGGSFSAQTAGAAQAQSGARGELLQKAFRSGTISDDDIKGAGRFAAQKGTTPMQNETIPEELKQDEIAELEPLAEGEAYTSIFSLNNEIPLFQFSSVIGAGEKAAKAQPKPDAPRQAFSAGGEPDTIYEQDGVFRINGVDATKPVKINYDFKRLVDSVLNA